jgi:hypothetical protein
VPVHPALAVLLDAWWRDGFELTFGRRPRSSDWIVPRRRASDRPHTKSSAYKAFQRACELLGIENRSLHSTRHTMITWTRRGGARADVLEKITHNAAGRIMDQYTHWDWQPLCEAVLCRDYAGVAAGRARGAVQLVASPSTVTAALAGGPIQAPAYDARYDACSGSIEIVDESGGHDCDQFEQSRRWSWILLTNGVTGAAVHHARRLFGLPIAPANSSRRPRCA